MGCDNSGCCLSPSQFRFAFAFSVKERDGSHTHVVFYTFLCWLLSLSFIISFRFHIFSEGERWQSTII